MMRRSFLWRENCTIASQSGQAFPLFTTLLALFSALGFGITKSIRSHTVSFVEREERIQSEIQKRSKEAFSLNEIANNNIRMRNLIREILLRYDSSLSSAFNLSSSTPLWEKDLPIPSPYNVFQSLDVAMPGLLSDVSKINSNNALLLQNVSQELNRRLMRLSLAESVCILSCSDPNEKFISGSRCQVTRSMRSDCSLQISGAFLSPPSLKSLPVRAILPSESGLFGGFIVFNLDEKLPNQKLFSDEVNAQHFAHKGGWRIDIVHPRICNVSKPAFRLPCASKIEKNNFGQMLSKTIVFEPHWSISVEY